MRPRHKSLMAVKVRAGAEAIAVNVNIVEDGDVSIFQFQATTYRRQHPALHEGSGCRMCA